MRTAAIGRRKGKEKPFEKGFSFPFLRTPIPILS
jgi:hypothetical protein